MGDPKQDCRRLPYFPLYVRDHLAETSHLTREEKGIYVDLLCECWRTPGCSIPADRKWIQRRLRVSEEEYERAVQPVLEEFFQLQRKRYFNERLRAEWARIKKTSDGRRVAGQKGGRARQAAGKMPDEPKPGSSKPGAGLEHTEPDPDPDPDPEKGGGGGSARARASGSSLNFHAEGGASLQALRQAAKVDVERIPAAWSESKLALAVAQWRTDLGLTPEEIISIATEVAAGLEPGTIGSPKYLNRAMQRSAGRKAAGEPALKPIAPAKRGTGDARPRFARETAWERRERLRQEAIAAEREEAERLARFYGGGSGDDG